MLEIGCGDGRLTWKYAGQSRAVLAIDLDRLTVVAARGMVPAMRLPRRVDFAQAAAESLPARRESFDLAIFAWSL